MDKTPTMVLLDQSGDDDDDDKERDNDDEVTEADEPSPPQSEDDADADSGTDLLEDILENEIPDTAADPEVAELEEPNEPKRPAVTIIDCPVCRKPVRTRRLARHQRSQRCQMAAVLALQAQDAAAEEAKTRAQKKKLLAPRRTFLDVPMVSPKGALTSGLLDFLLNTANTAASTANDAVSCLRKIAGVKYPVTAELTAPQLYALLVDTETLQAFFKVLEGSGMKACSRKRYVDAIRLGLTWLETRSPQEPGTPPASAAATFVESLRSLRVCRTAVAGGCQRHEGHAQYTKEGPGAQEQDPEEPPQPQGAARVRPHAHRGRTRPAAAPRRQ